MQDGLLKDQLQRMYKMSKKNIEKDEKVQEYMKKTEKHLKKLDESTKRVKKDLETELITQILKEEHDDKSKTNNEDFSSLT